MEKWVLLIIVLVCASHFSAILIYFLQKIFYEKAAIVTREKYHGMVERLIVVSCFLIPGNLYYVILTFVVCLVVFERFSMRGAKNLDFSFLNIASSNILAVSFSIIARNIWY